MQAGAAAEFPSPEVVNVMWPQAYRVISTRVPPIQVFEAYYDKPADFETAFAIESLTNPERLQEAGDLQRVPREDRVFGPGASYLMRPFTHVSPRSQSRFSDGSFGVYYAADSLSTAIAETRYHYERWLQRTPQSATSLYMRVLVNQVREPLHDLRPAEYGALFHPTVASYPLPQSYARAAKADGAAGLLYPSVRRPGSECVAIFRPRALTLPSFGPNLCYHWNVEQQCIDEVERLVVE